MAIGMDYLETESLATVNAAEQWRLPIAHALALAILALEAQEADCRQTGDEENGAEFRQALVTLRELRGRVVGKGQAVQ